MDIGSIVFGPSHKTLDRFFVGYEAEWNRLNDLHTKLIKPGGATYPPYNIVKVDPSSYIIELAVAGFRAEDIDIELDDGVLTIVGKKTTTDTFIHQGIAQRDFKRSFVLNEQIQVSEVHLCDGMLRINLIRIAPEVNKPLKIPIITPKQLLCESS